MTQPSQDITAYPAYHAALTAAAFYRVPDAGAVRIAGADRADFIQRQTTNDVRLLAPDRAVTTVLTTGTAKVLDVWRLIGVPGADAIDAITLPGRGAAALSYLRKHIFFKDRVTVEDASGEAAQVELLGPASADLLADVCGSAAPAPNTLATHDAGAGTVRILGPDAAIGRGWLLVGAPQALDALIAALGAAALDAGTYDVLRVEAGVPAAGHELNGEYTPLEAALDHAVSGTKGCYSGQEVIARQITYDKIARRLIGLRLDAPAVAGAPVLVEGRTAGAITSAAVSPRLGPIALAVLRRPHFEPGVAVMVSAESGPVAGRTTALPFEA